MIIRPPAEPLLPPAEPSLPPGTPSTNNARVFDSESGGESALCLSGGGIRSATFSLGALQALAKFGWLSRFDYLSTVSGGGYIGSWLSAWIYRQQEEILDDLDPARRMIPDVDLRAQAVVDVEASLLESVTRGRTEPEQLRRLRAYSNYLSPVAGVSGDFLSLISIFIRNLSLNWVVLFPAFLAIVLIPITLSSVAELLRPQVSNGIFWDICVSLAGLCAVIAIAYAYSDLPDKEFHQTKHSFFWRLWMLPMGVCCLALSLPIMSQVLNECAQFLPPKHRWFAYGFYPLWTIICGAAVHLVGNIVGAFFRVRRAPVNPSIPSRAPASSSLFNAEVGRFGAKWLGATALSGAAAGLLVWCAAAMMHRALPTPDCEHHVPLVGLDGRMLLYTFTVPALIIIFQTGTTIFLAVLSDSADEGAREWWGRSGGYVLLFCAIWIAAFVLCIQVPAWTHLIWGKVIAATGGVGGLIAALVGYFGRSSANGADETNVRPVRVRLADGAARVGAALFIASLAVLLSLLVVHVRGLFMAPRPPYLEIVASCPSLWATLAVAAGAVFWGAAWVVKRNRYSLSALYGNRLTRAFLGAARRGASRSPHAFTGFDPADDIRLADLPAGGPLRHFINAALNVSEPNSTELASQERKASSFVFAADRCGRPEVKEVASAYECDSSYYAAADGMTLGRAMAISGAAASPNMGFHTSPLVAFVLTFFNIRLGAWLPNPLWAPEEPEPNPITAEYVRRKALMQKEEPSAPHVLVSDELLGRTRSSDPFIYVSDGGHFENLGLYDMVRRRCTRIVVIDASCDPKYQYDDLERALRMIRADLGVTIEFDGGLPRPADNGLAKCHWVTAKIHYGRASRDAPCEYGKLLYVKPCLTGDEHVDVLAFAVRSRRNGIPFPHHSTGDQFFDEARFESYRALGYHSLNGASDSPADFAAFDFPKLDTSPTLAAGSIAEQLAESAQEGAAARSTLMSRLKWIAGLLVALGLITPVAYHASESSSQNVLMVLPEQHELALRGADTLRAVFLNGRNRIALPLFDRASGCGSAGVEHCAVGTKASQAGRELLENLAGALDACASSASEEASGGAGKIEVDLRGYSDSSDFAADARAKTLPIGTRNTQLADRRACVVYDQLMSARRNPNVAYVLKSWNREPLDHGQCRQLESRAYSDSDVEALDRGRVNDAGDDPLMAMLNRRVELLPQWPPGGACSIDALEKALGKYYSVDDALPPVVKH
jgi:hypothetical protein